MKHDCAECIHCKVYDVPYIDGRIIWNKGRVRCINGHWLKRDEGEFTYNFRAFNQEHRKAFRECFEYEEMIDFS